MLSLAQHFFADFFRLSFLDDAGEESFRRVIIGVLAAFLAFGLWLPRVLAARYLAVSHSADTYQLTLWSDQLFIIAVSMFVVAFATALVAHSLFPDELDYRILMALPLSRSTIFGAKLLALLLFAALFILTTSVAFSMPLSLISRSDLARHVWPIRAAALTFTSACAALFACTAVISVQGLVVMLAPRDRLRAISVVTQTSLVCCLVLLLPIVLRSGGQTGVLAGTAPSILPTPSTWFLGLHEVLLNDASPVHSRLAALGATAMGAALLVTLVSYAVAYRRFDQTIVRSQAVQHVRRDPIRSVFGAPAFTAVRAFTTATLMRSGLHQLVFYGTSAAGAALAVNLLLAAGNPRELAVALHWAPFPLVFGAVFGVHAAMLLPVARRAAWIFRLAEHDGSRAWQIAAAEHVLITRGVLHPIAIVLPIQFAAFGVQSALAGTPVLLAMGLALAQLRLVGWHRIPFTCSYMPGKRPVAHTLLLGITSFAGFTSIGYALHSRAVDAGHPPVLALGGLLAVAATARWLRAHTGRKPLEFEDELPESTYGLHLNT